MRVGSSPSSFIPSRSFSVTPSLYKVTGYYQHNSSRSRSSNPLNRCFQPLQMPSNNPASSQLSASTAGRAVVTAPVPSSSSRRFRGVPGGEMQIQWPSSPASFRGMSTWDPMKFWSVDHVQTWSNMIMAWFMAWIHLEFSIRWCSPVIFLLPSSSSDIHRRRFHQVERWSLKLVGGWATNPSEKWWSE